MRTIIKNLLLVILSTALISCGYTLRGNLNLPDDVRNIALITGSYSPMSSEINLLLTNIGVETSDSRTTEGYQIEIISEIHNKRQLSINEAGRVNEYELIFTTTFKINTPLENGKNESVTLYRDYLFDESRILGTTDREDEIKKEMISTAASIIINKLKAKIGSM